MTTPPLPSLSSEMPFNLDPNLTPLSEAFHKARSFQHKKYQQLKEQNELKKHLVVNLLHSVLSLTQGQIYPPLSLNSWTLNEPSITFQCFGNEPQTTSTSTSTSNLPPLNYSMVASKWIHVPDTDLPFPFHVLQVTVLDSPPLGITAVVHLKNTSTETLRNVYVSPLFSSVPITTLSTNRHCKELRPSTSIHLSCFIQVPWTYPSHSLQVHLMLHWNDTQHCSLGGHGVQQTLLTPCWIEYPISLPLNVQCKNSLPEVFHQLMAPEFAFSVLALSTLVY
ncbi:hypothetical protein HMI56_004610 [Coelomomyces lativittatus]|nr:hypothetical protein HMI56_004610 [Coelomomyces lativittatus]